MGRGSVQKGESVYEREGDISYFRDDSELVEPQDLVRERILDNQFCTRGGATPVSKLVASALVL